MPECTQNTGNVLLERISTSTINILLTFEKIDVAYLRSPCPPQTVSSTRFADQHLLRENIGGGGGEMDEVLTDPLFGMRWFHLSYPGDKTMV